MMTSRDRMIRTLNHEPVDRAPRDLWLAPTMERSHGDDVAEMNLRFPSDVARPEFRCPLGQRTKGSPHEQGEYTDAWGSTWRASERGTLGEVLHAPLADLRQVGGYRPPVELLDAAGFSTVNRSCAATSRFVLAWTDVRPLGRMQCLHGTEATLVDLASGGKPLETLLGMLHDFYCRELSLWAATDVDGVVFADDWGSNQGLLISPEVFRDLFKPLYRQYCEILHAQDKYAMFRSCGNIEEIFDDLLDIGVDAVHAPLYRMDVEALADRFRNRLTFWGDSTGEQTLARATAGEIKASVHRVRTALDFGRGGLVAQCEWKPTVPFRNIVAMFDEWQAPLPMHARADEG